MKRLIRLLRTGLISMGALGLLVVALCFTSYPWRMYYWLSMPEAVLHEAPEWIVVLGGGGIPSESGLMRTYYGAQAAMQFPSAQIYVALPGDPAAAEGAGRRMAQELVMRGVDPARIDFESTGTNTRSQAVALRRMTGKDVVEWPVLIVTSPEHMRRAVRTFQRAGFAQAGGQAAMDTGIDHGLAVSEADVDGRLAAPALEGSLFVRYQFWHGITYLSRSAREWVALFYYRLKGWI